MNTVPRLALTALLVATPFCCNADNAQTSCWRDQVEVHVRQQYLVYGPQSIKHEYFGFIYERHGVIDSAVVRGNYCPNPGSCVVNTNAAGVRIPPGARVLGEWHTHPRRGSSMLSMADVRGAYNNRHIRCYIAFYGNPKGEIYAWDPKQTSVPTAMASRVLIGNYATQVAEVVNSNVE